MQTNMTNRPNMRRRTSFTAVWWTNEINASVLDTMQPEIEINHLGTDPMSNAQLVS